MPPHKPGTPAALIGQWRGIGIQAGYKYGEWDGMFNSSSFVFTDANRSYTFTIRRGVGEVAPVLLPDCDLIIRTTEAICSPTCRAGVSTSVTSTGRGGNPAPW